MALVTLHHWLSESLPVSRDPAKSQIMFPLLLIETPSPNSALVLSPSLRVSKSRALLSSALNSSVELSLALFHTLTALEGDFNCNPFGLQTTRVSFSMLFHVLYPRTYMTNSYLSLIPRKHFVSIDAYVCCQENKNVCNPICFSFGLSCQKS